MISESKIARTWQGAKIGALVGITFLAVGIASWLVARLTGYQVDASFRGFALLTPMYVGSFILGGAIVGLLWDLRRNMIGAIVLGILGASIVFGCLMLIVVMQCELNELEFTAFSITAVSAYILIMGVIMGYYFRKAA